LAWLMKRICHFLLKEMGKPSSPVYWVEESVQNEPYRAANDQLVEIFERLLGFAEKLNCPPDANWTQALLSRLMDELRKTFMGICFQHGQHVHKKQVESPKEVYGNYEGEHRPC